VRFAFTPPAIESQELSLLDFFSRQQMTFETRIPRMMH
jgi:hypothetical protein